MFSVAPNIVLVPNMTQNAERKHRTQTQNTEHKHCSYPASSSCNVRCHLQFILLYANSNLAKYLVNLKGNVSENVYILLCDAMNRTLLQNVQFFPNLKLNISININPSSSILKHK